MKSTTAIAVMISLLVAAAPARAAKDNTFSMTVAVGEAFGVSDYRLSFGSIDFGFGVGRGLYLGSRLWKDAYYAGFGLCTQDAPGWYGMVGYEWRFVPLAGMTFEFQGSTHSDGSTSASGLMGVTIGW